MSSSEQLAHSEYVDEESRRIAIEKAQEIEEAARQRGMGGDLSEMSDPALGLLMLGLIVVVDHHGLPHGLHADGPRHVLRLSSPIYRAGRDPGPTTTSST